jgi:hypothetical protein
MTAFPNTVHVTSIALNRWLCVGLVVGLAACSPSDAQHPPSGPSPQDIAAAYHPNYVPTKDGRSECLGRVVFEVGNRSEFEWGLPHEGADHEIMGFSRLLRSDRDGIQVGNVSVLVFDRANLRSIQELQRMRGVAKSIAMQDFDENIRISKLSIEDFAQQLETPELKADRQKTADFKAAMNRDEEKVAALKLRKQNLDKDWHPTEWGLPDSTGYMAGTTLYAFLLRGGYAFQFMSTGGEGEPPFEQRVAAFKNLLSRFEPRSLYQVPNKAGVCIPHGFIADDGKGPFNADVSFRYADSPGVIYTLSTGVVGERNYEPNDPLIEATARATVSAVIGNSYGRKLKVLGPKSTKIGARSGLLGGISTAEGAPGYSVYAGVGGVPSSQVLPHISLNMRSFDKQTAPDDVKVDPPPFEQSLQRFEQTLVSARTRKAP